MPRRRSSSAGRWQASHEQRGDDGRGERGDVPHLVALKLYAGGQKSASDVLELLARHPDEDLEALGALCARLGLASEWETLLKAKGA